jgi:surfeit locus 1 family protein
MLNTLRQPKWVAATVVVLLLAGLFVRLGLWQLDRLQERKLENAVGIARSTAEPVDLGEALRSVQGDLESLEHLNVVVTGEYDPGEEVLIRSQVALGQAVYHVITPLVVGEGEAVLVNRGWVPLGMDEPPVGAAPEPGTQEVTGFVHLSATRPPLGAEEPEGDLGVMNRVDVERIGEQVPYDLAPVYVVTTGETGDQLPIPVDPPDFTDEGPHLAYAIQWFGFAVIGLVGFWFLLRRSSRQTS